MDVFRLLSCTKKGCLFETLKHIISSWWEHVVLLVLMRVMCIHWTRHSPSRLMPQVCIKCLQSIQTLLLCYESLYHHLRCHLSSTPTPLTVSGYVYKHQLLWDKPDFAARQHLGSNSPSLCLHLLADTSKLLSVVQTSVASHRPHSSYGPNLTESYNALVWEEPLKVI